MASLLEDFRSGSIRSLARLISLVEEGKPDSLTLLGQLFPLTGKAKIIGITGPPGAGKSSLIAGLIKEIRKLDKRVAVIAVDPASPLNGGALLGDRIRLSHHFNDESVFIRSLSTRGQLGGLSQASQQAVHLVDAFGFDYILFETVGVGQNEIDVKDITDCVAAVLVPESGDSIQAIKSGLLEVADILAVNKSDRPGAAKLQNELKTMLEIAERNHTPVLQTQADEASTITALFNALDSFLADNEGLIKKRRESAVRNTAIGLIEQGIFRSVSEWLKANISDVENPYEFLAKWEKTHSMEPLYKKWQN